MAIGSVAWCRRQAAGRIDVVRSRLRMLQRAHHSARTVREEERDERRHA